MATSISVGTFNLKNLFSRFNFEADLATMQAPDGIRSETARTVIDGDTVYRERRFMGRIVKAKKKKDREAIAERIMRMNVDVLAVQEVEDIDILKSFNHNFLGGMYPHYTLIEGNDQRLIDVAIYSKFPLGRVVTWHQYRHPSGASKPVFSRDLLQADVLDKRRRNVLFTVFNTHLKSHFGDHEDNGRSNNARRKKQAEAIRDIVKREMGASDRYVVTGDMNDPVASTYLKPFTSGLFNALQSPKETRPPKADNPMPATTAWTHRWVEDGVAEHHLYDQIWLSPSLKNSFVSSHIDRRKKHGGDGSDHDPAWVKLKLT